MASCCKCSHQLEWCEGEKYYYCLNPFCIAEGRPQTIVPEPAASMSAGPEWPGDHTGGDNFSAQCDCKSCRAIRLAALNGVTVEPAPAAPESGESVPISPRVAARVEEILAERGFQGYQIDKGAGGVLLQARLLAGFGLRQFAERIGMDPFRLYEIQDEGVATDAEWELIAANLKAERESMIERIATLTTELERLKADYQELVGIAEQLSVGIEMMLSCSLPNDVSGQEMIRIARQSKADYAALAGEEKQAECDRRVEKDYQRDHEDHWRGD